MEMDATTIVELAGLLLGSGGIAAFATLKYERMRIKGEARNAENEATKSVQDVYQEMVADVKADREEQKEYIRELKEERMHLKTERNELRKRLDDTDDKMRLQEKQIARLGNRIDSLTPFICTLTGCKQRVRNYIGLVSDDSFEVTAGDTAGTVEEKESEEEEVKPTKRKKGK